MQCAWAGIFSTFITKKNYSTIKTTVEVIAPYITLLQITWAINVLEFSSHKICKTFKVDSTFSIFDISDN